MKPASFVKDKNGKIVLDLTRDDYFIINRTHRARRMPCEVDFATEYAALGLSFEERMCRRFEVLMAMEKPHILQGEQIGLRGQGSDGANGGGPGDLSLYTDGAKGTDLLITWLYKMTLGSADTRYYDASIIGICVFLVVAVLSLIVYNIIPSTKNEEDYK